MSLISSSFKLLSLNLSNSKDVSAHQASVSLTGFSSSGGSSLVSAQYSSWVVLCWIMSWLSHDYITYSLTPTLGCYLTPNFSAVKCDIVSQMSIAPAVSLCLLYVGVPISLFLHLQTVQFFSTKYIIAVSNGRLLSNVYQRKNSRKKKKARQERGSWTSDRALFSIRFSDISTLLL